MKKVGFLSLIFILWSTAVFAQVDFLQWQNPNSAYFKIHNEVKTYKRVNINHLIRYEGYKTIEVFDAQELRKALDTVTGKKIILLRRSLRGEKFKYYRNPKLGDYKERVYLIGMLDNGDAPFLDSAIWADMGNITISHLRVNRGNVRVPKEGFIQEYAWEARRVNGFRISNIHFFGSDDGLKKIAQGSREGVFNDPTGIFIESSDNVVVDRNLFENLFNAVLFQNITNFDAVSNRADKITSDMFSGGALVGGLFDSNLSLTKTPVKFKLKGKDHYVHSDVIQLYTRVVNKSNRNITIRNNVVLKGNSPVKNKLSAGWQCFFTRDEAGDPVPKINKKETFNTQFSNIRIYNNLCMSNQHHGITMSRGVNNLVTGNVVVELGVGDKNVTAGVRVRNQKSARVTNNLAKKQIFEDNSTTCDFGNNLELGAKDNVVAFFKRRYVQTKRLLITRKNYTDVVNPRDEFVSAEESASRTPEQVLDFKKMQFVPFKR